MRKFILLLVFVVLAKMNFAQSVFAPIGSYFNYYLISHTGGFNGERTLYYTGDTIINTQNVKKICTASYVSCVCPNPPSYYSYCSNYLLERNDSLFEFFQDSLQLLYSFNMNVGDSIVFEPFPAPTDFRYILVLDSVGSIVMCGATREVLYYSKIQTSCPWIVMPYTVVRGIGPIDDYLFYQTNGCEMGADRYGFSCLNTGSCTFPSGNCVGQGLSIKENKQIEGYVSTISNGIHVSFSKALSGRIIISSIIGATIFNDQLLNTEYFECNTSQLAKGIYTFAINCNDGTNLAGKFIVE
ncbi:MAG: hypothetical protein IPG89_18045 [Bacteroidetes bacterium]|nr:hypothetical protein [Bacteroidota bacterium]